MKSHLFFSILVTFLLTACGGGSSSPSNTISSFTEIKESLEANGYSLEKLQTSSKVEASKLNFKLTNHKVANNELRITYDENKSITFSTSSLYLIRNQSNETIFATVDGNATADNAEAKTMLQMEHNISTIPIGYVNLNTTTSNANANKETILAELKRAFKQFTLSNVTAPTQVESDELNISYQTALQNQDKTFTCNGETKVLDAQKGYTTLSNLSQGAYVCKHGEISLLSFTVIANSDIDGDALLNENDQCSNGSDILNGCPVFTISDLNDIFASVPSDETATVTIPNTIRYPIGTKVETNDIIEKAEGYRDWQERAETTTNKAREKFKTKKEALEQIENPSETIEEIISLLDILSIGYTVNIYSSIEGTEDNFIRVDNTSQEVQITVIQGESHYWDDKVQELLDLSNGLSQKPQEKTDPKVLAQVTATVEGYAQVVTPTPDTGGGTDGGGSSSNTRD